METLQMSQMLINESVIERIVTEALSRLLNESATRVLYHFLNFHSFEQLVKTNRFITSDAETSFNNGLNYISFSRTGSFREGWPVLMFSGEDGKGDDWCAIRLTINGGLMSQKPNFHINGRQYHMSVRPFDYCYHENNEGDIFSFADNTGVFAHNGKEWMMQSDDYTNSYLPIPFENGYVDGIGDKQGHPYSQAEDRLVTDAPYIPDAFSFINRVDIVVMPHAFNEYNWPDRKSLYSILTKSNFKEKFHVYPNIHSLEHNKHKLSDYEILLIPNGKEAGYQFMRPKHYTIKQDF